ncbi:TonB-dependent receptor [Ignavibacteriales bacterium]
MYKFVVLLAIFGFVDALPQFGGLKGIVSADGEPLPGVTIRVLDTKSGTVSNSDGYYELKNLPAGKINLQFTYVGYLTIDKTVTIEAGRILTANISLTEKNLELDEIVISDKARDASDTETSIIDLEPEQAKVLPGAGEDVLRTLQALPGILAPNDFSSQLVVRGSGPDQNLIIIDNVEIFNPYRLYGFISMFNPDAVSDITLITGGFPVKYGDRLSAVLDVSNREGTPKKSLTGSLNASITNANLVLEGKNPFNIRGGWMINSRRTYYDLILEPFAKNAGLVEEETAFPNFYDIQAKVTFGPFDGHKINLFGIYSADGVDIVSGSERKTPDSVSVNNVTRNDVLGLTWEYSPNAKFFLQNTLSWYNNSGDAGFSAEILDPSLNRESFKDFSADTIRPYLFGFQVNSTFLFEKFSWDTKTNLLWGNNNILEAGFGADVLKSTLIFDFEFDPQLRAIFSANPNFRSSIGDIKDTKTYNRYRGFVQNKFNLWDRVYINPGVRFDHYEIIGKSYLAPRISASLQIDELTTLRGACGIFYQSPGYEKLLDAGVLYDFSPVNVSLLEAEKAIHYVLGIEKWLSFEWNLKLEAYYKDFSNLIVPKIVTGTKYYTERVPGQDPNTTAGWTRPVTVQSDSITQIPVNNSYGESYGLELMLAKKNMDRNSSLSGWISYSFSVADRFERNFTVPFRFDQRHTLNIVLDYQFAENWNLGVRWQYGSGFPNTTPEGLRPRIIAVDTDGDLKPDTPQFAVRKSSSDPNSTEIIYDIAFEDKNRFNSRKPVYHRLDIRITAAARFWNLNWNFYLDVINVYNRSNIIGYDYYVTENKELGVKPTSMFPILPTLGFSIKF